MRIRNIKQGLETLYPLHQVESSGIKWNQVLIRIPRQKHLAFILK